MLYVVSGHSWATGFAFSRAWLSRLTPDPAQAGHSLSSPAQCTQILLKRISSCPNRRRTSSCRDSQSSSEIVSPILYIRAAFASAIALCPLVVSELSGWGCCYTPTLPWYPTAQWLCKKIIPLQTIAYVPLSSISYVIR
ncbi:ABC-type glutathione transport system ATPase component [Pseudomonas syringae pv. actinidiae]|uniref:ABC-type glutathione transport system ATPase component n=1 Tax=Pseudomonas syringae pv. actinidiae TaxID=103796 RepID=A0A2V0QII6_PSESF|nr:ABC-type glutathione transport system ATPase component [Pseudomonas syringae pv. actinidiae]